MWIRPLAIAAFAMLLVPLVVSTAPAIAGLLVGIAACAAIWAVVAAIGPRLKPKDAYDLGELKRVHEEEEIRALDPEGALGTPERVVCSRCFHEYPFRLGACPRCGASR